MQGALYGNTPPDQQTVPFAELYAIIQLLRHTVGSILIWSDCTFTVNGFRNQRWRMLLDKHYELWKELGEAAEQRSIVLKWTKAHVKAKHVLSGLVQLENVFGNAVADLVAKAGAALDSVSAGIELGIGFLEGRAHLIRTRLVAIQ